LENKKTILSVFVAIGLLFIAGAIYWFVSTPEKLPEIMSTEKKACVETLAIPTVAEKKARFKNLIIPAIDDVYAELSKKYQTIIVEISSDPNSAKLSQLRKEYRVKDNQALLMALKPHPRSIAIAQAAMESSWATSRFCCEANNIFGIWSFDENEPRIAAGEQRGDKTIWVKKYSSIKDSINDYYRTVARGDAFKDFRALKMQTNDPFELVKKLDHYSEKGALYGEELASIIKFNHFIQYDK
jgi:Bax protein